MTELTAHGHMLARLNYRPQTWLLFLALSQRKGQWGLRRLQVLPAPPRSWLRWLFDQIPIHLLGLRYADFALCAGSEAERHPLIGPRTVILRTCAEDVFRMEEVKPDPLHTQPYAVFLDEAIDWPHQDYAILGRTPPNAKTYRHEMKHMLSAWAKRLRMPIVTAYRSNWITPTLIYHASCVLAHSSTAVSFAVLWDKSIHILIPPCLKGRPEGRNATAMQEALARGYQDYCIRYLGTSEAMAKKVRPEKILEEYLHD